MAYVVTKITLASLEGKTFTWKKELKEFSSFLFVEFRNFLML
ncbi:hypothetical protein bcere0009_20270 [Bacillus cereus R309803]|nr:hypothetical protein bcere0009_20270 [Bacillus cereus R309803]